MERRSINSGANSFVTTYDCKDVKEVEDATTTTTKVSSIDNNGKSISYTYDHNGNIATITENNKVITYSYNELNELTREDNQVLNKTIVYSYDAGGNFKTKIEYPYTDPLVTPSGATNTVSYTYGDTNWKDKLTKFNGKTITYDAIGNPLTYDGYTYTWEWGRQLSSMTGNGKTISYKYNDSGIRTQKTVNNITTNYHLVGDKVTYEDNGTDKIYYTYDSSGNLVSMNLNGVEYYYIRNAQGDIIGLFDNTGKQVASYTYDSWGKLISIKDGSGADITNNTTSVGYKNPYRYRGYRYDTETGLYYLQSRYYNSEWSRFINADGYGGKIGDLLSHNLFAYCKNNPVNLMDSDGNYGFLAALGGIAGGAAILTAATVAIGAVAVVATVVLVITAVTEAINHYEAAQLVSNASSNSSGNAKASSSGGIGIGTGSGGSTIPPNNNGKQPKKIVEQMHHFLTNKNTKYTPQIAAIVTKYRLDLNAEWNKKLMPHLGRHPNIYHDFMLNSIRSIDKEANGDVQIFLSGFQKVKDFIISNPDKLYKRGW